MLSKNEYPFDEVSITCTTETTCKDTKKYTKECTKEELKLLLTSSNDFSLEEEVDSKDFEIVNRADDIFMISRNQSFLSEKVEVLKQYSKLVLPWMKQGEAKIHEIQSNHYLFNKGYTHYVKLNNILPKLVTVLYSNHPNYGSYSNCHGMALLGAGIVPVVSSLQSPLIGLRKVLKSHEVTIENIQPGDLIFYTKNSHSFIFLDKDICLSMNGRGQSFEILPTDFVINKYKMPPNMIDKGDPDAMIFRKNKNWSIPEPIYKTLVEFYELNPFSYMCSTDRNSHLLAPIARTLKNAYLQAQEEDIENDRYFFRFVFNTVLDSMPCRISHLLDEEDKEDTHSNKMYETSKLGIMG